MSYQRFSRLFRRLGRQKGRNNEGRFFSAFKDESAPLPDWFVGIERATREEDCCGIDAVLITKDVGKIFVQIKSSKSGRRKFKDFHPHNPKHIVVVVVRTEDGAEEIRQCLWRTVAPERQRLLALRSCD